MTEKSETKTPEAQNQQAIAKASSQEVEPQIDPGAVDPRAWYQLDGGRLHAIAFRFCAAEHRQSHPARHQPSDGVAAAAEGFRTDPDPTLATLKEIQSAQEKHFAALQANNVLLQQNAALLQQDSLALVSLRQSVDEQAGTKKISAQIADEHQDVKKISGQISALTAKVDSLKSVMASDVTASISAKQSGNRSHAYARRWLASRIRWAPFRLAALR